MRKVKVPVWLWVCMLIAVIFAVWIVLSSFTADESKDEEVPIDFGYERVEIVNLQSTPNGTYIYVLLDTATNTEYLYVLRESGEVGHIGYSCTSSIVEIGDYVEEIKHNQATEDLIKRNEMSHTSPNKPGGFDLIGGTR